MPTSFFRVLFNRYIFRDYSVVLQGFRPYAKLSEKNLQFGFLKFSLQEKRFTSTKNSLWVFFGTRFVHSKDFALFDFALPISAMFSNRDLFLWNNEQAGNKSAPYLRLKKTRKPLFLQLETTKALKKLKIEKKFLFFLFFFEVSGKSHSAEKCKRGDAFYLMLDALDALKMKY